MLLNIDSNAFLTLAAMPFLGVTLFCAAMYIVVGLIGRE